MADIKDLGIFGRNKGLKKMKKDAEEKKRLADTTEKSESIPVTEEATQVAKNPLLKTFKKTTFCCIPRKETVSGCTCSKV